MTAAIAPLSAMSSLAMPRPRALTASRAAVERQGAGLDESAVFAEAVTDHHVRLDAVGLQHPG